jgi:hypothetical protein
MLLELAQWSVRELPLFALVAVGTHLVVSAYTPYFLVPTIAVAGVMFFVLPLDLFLRRGHGGCGVVLCARPLRQGIPRGGIETKALCLVQT